MSEVDKLLVVPLNAEVIPELEYLLRLLKYDKFRSPTATLEELIAMYDGYRGRVSTSGELGTPVAEFTRIGIKLR